jgi:hypothetical protein
VKCIYTSAQYPEVANALQERTTVIHFSGNITYDRVARIVSELRVDRMERARVLTPAEFEEFFGSAPQFTGDMSTSEYVDSIRGDG